MMGPTQPYMRRSLAFLALFVAYLAAAKLGLSLAFVHPSATPIWPPTGIAIAGVLLLGPSARPLIFVAAFLINAITAGTLGTALAIGVGNVLEASAGAYFIERWAGGRRMLDRAPTIFRFVALMAPTAAISATIGVTTLAIAGHAPWSQYVSIWLTWWMGDLSGGLLVVPLVLAWLDRGAETRADVTPIEIAMLFALVCASAAVTFGGVGPWPNHTPLAFLTIPPLVWAAFRFGLRYASLAIAAMSTIATWSTVRGSGPFALPSANTALLILATFIATLTATMLPIAAVVAERRRAEEERARLLDREHAARVERRGDELGEGRLSRDARPRAAEPALGDRHRGARPEPRSQPRRIGGPRAARDQSPGQASGAAGGRSARRHARHHWEGDAGP